MAADPDAKSAYQWRVEQLDDGYWSSVFGVYFIEDDARQVFADLRKRRLPNPHALPIRLVRCPLTWEPVDEWSPSAKDDLGAAGDG